MHSLILLNHSICYRMAETGNLKREELNPNDVGEYTVQEILKKKLIRGKRHYQIKWLGYPHEENTWEPIEHLTTVPEMLKVFEKEWLLKRKKKPTPKCVDKMALDDDSVSLPRKFQIPEVLQQSKSSVPPIKKYKYTEVTTQKIEESQQLSSVPESVEPQQIDSQSKHQQPTSESAPRYLPPSTPYTKLFGFSINKLANLEPPRESQSLNLLQGPMSVLQISSLNCVVTLKNTETQEQHTDCVLPLLLMLRNAPRLLDHKFQSLLEEHLSKQSQS